MASRDALHSKQTCFNAHILWLERLSWLELDAQLQYVGYQFLHGRKDKIRMSALGATEAPKTTEEEIEGIEIGKDGKVFTCLPHLVSHMTQPDQVQVLEWYVKEGDIVTDGHQERDMIHLDFLGDDWFLPIPPLNGPMRVVEIRAEVGKIIRLNDPLIVFEPVQVAA
jgi:hypothetical protein